MGTVNRGETNRKAIAESLSHADIARDNEVDNKLTSRFVSKTQGLFSDPTILDAVNTWANAWGEYTQACKGANILNHEIDDLPDDIKPFANKLEDAVNNMESAISKSNITFRYYGLGKIGWTDDDGNECYVLLSA